MQVNVSELLNEYPIMHQFAAYLTQRMIQSPTDDRVPRCLEELLRLAQKAKGGNL